MLAICRRQALECVRAPQGLKLRAQSTDGAAAGHDGAGAEIGSDDAEVIRRGEAGGTEGVEALQQQGKIRQELVDFWRGAGGIIEHEQDVDLVDARQRQVRHRRRRGRVVTACDEKTQRQPAHLSLLERRRPFRQSRPEAVRNLSLLLGIVVAAQAT
jgi:hypothetical protein